MTLMRNVSPKDAERSDLTILRLPAVRARTGLSRSTIYQRIADGKFPRPVPIGARAVGFLLAEVDAWIVAQVGVRDGHRVVGGDK